jgi:hypothetical protein
VASLQAQFSFVLRVRIDHRPGMLALTLQAFGVLLGGLGLRGERRAGPARNGPSRRTLLVRVVPRQAWPPGHVPSCAGGRDVGYDLRRRAVTPGSSDSA